MPVKIVRPDHLEIVGTGLVLLTAPHAKGPQADLHTGDIVEHAALVSKSYAVIGKVSREYVDLNRIQSAKTEFRKAIQTFIEEDGIRCIIDVHGKIEPGVDIGTSKGKSASEETVNLVHDILSKEFVVNTNSEFSGTETGTIVETYGETLKKKGRSVEAVQLEFGHEERTVHKDKIVNALANIALSMNLLQESQ